MGDPNVLAYLTLLAWIPTSVVLFAKFRGSIACALCLLGGVLFLPEVAEFKIPGLPAFDKRLIAPVACMLGALIYRRRRLRRSRVFGLIEALIDRGHPGHTRRIDASDFLIALLIIASAATALTNDDPIAYGDTVLPPVTLYDGMHVLVQDILGLALPFILGRTFFRDYRELVDLLVVIASLCLIYSILILIEVRLSPQLHNWIYGVAQHDFRQTMRAGGFRPMVFMHHGLATSLFVASALLAASGLSKARLSIGRVRRTKVASGYLAVLLLLVKSLGAQAMGYIGVILIAFTRPRVQAAVSAVLAMMVVAYPILRFMDVLPVQDIAEAVADFNEERAQSLNFRFENETALLDHASKRPLFGWGTFGRASVYDNWSGDELSTRDGAWIIALGDRGIVGFVAVFGLVLLPLFGTARTIRQIRSERARILLGALALLVGVRAFDLIPNGIFSYMTLFLAGALSGLRRSIVASERAAAAPRRRRVQRMRRSNQIS